MLNKWSIKDFILPEPIINLIPHHSKLQWKFYATLTYRLSFNSLIYFNGKIIVVAVVQPLRHVKLCDSMNYSTTGFPVLYCLPEFAQTLVC